MKSQRRHELEKNQLADYLAGFINKVKPYQNLILVGLIIVAVVIAGYSLSVRRSAAATAEGWDRFYEAFTEDEPNPATFDQLSKQYPNTELGHWSAAIAGDLYLSTGCSELFEDRMNAHDALRQASERYKDLLDKSRSPMLKARAMIGLARTLEAQGNLTKAIQRYEEVIKNWPQGTFAALAAHRLDDLQRPTIGEWYEKFEEFDPQRAFASAPGVPGEQIPFHRDMLSEPPEQMSPEHQPLIPSELDFGPKPMGKPFELKMPSLDPGRDDDTPPPKDAKDAGDGKDAKDAEDGKDAKDGSPAATPEAPAAAPKDKPSPPEAKE